MPTFSLIPAEYGKRAVAYIVDVLFVVVPPVVALPLSLFLVIAGVPIPLWTLLLVCALGWLLIAGLWNDIVRQGTTGSTFGKSRQALALVKASTGESVGIGLAAVRILTVWFFNIFTGGLFLIADLLTPAFSKRNQRLVDMLLNTLVVDTSGSVTVQPVQAVEPVEEMDVNDDPFQ